MKRNGKYGVAPKEERTLDGIVFDSKAEATRYAQLKLYERGGAISLLSLQPEYRVEINGQHYCTYTADFKYFDALKERWVVEDVKSVATDKDPAFRLRRKAAELFHGIIVDAYFGKAKLTKPRKSRMIKK